MNAKICHYGWDISKDWYVYFSVRSPITGNLKRIIRKSKINYIHSLEGRKKAARLLVSDINSLLLDGWNPVGNGRQVLPLIDELQQGVELKKQILRRRTWQSYQYSLDLLKSWMKLKGMEYYFPEDFTKVHAREFCDHLLMTKKFTGKTFNGAKANIGTLFNILVDKEIIIKNPFSKIRKMKEEMGKNTAFTKKQAQNVSNYLMQHDQRLFLFTRFMYFTFIRPIELLRLKVSNIDLKNNKIVIYGSQSKNKRTEYVEIPKAFIPLIKSMKLHKHDPDDFIFGFHLETGPKSYSRNIVSIRHRNALDELKFSSDYTMYSWKHTGVVSAYNEGIGIYSIMRQCRHSLINQTQTYLRSLGLMPNTEFASKMK